VRRRRTLVRIPYGSPTRRCSQSSSSLWHSPRQSCHPMERERESQRGRE
jgi:hypothetical protein